MHIERPTWREVLPTDDIKKVYESMWLYKKKADGTAKARVVMLGNSAEEEDIDTFAPTCNKGILWLIFALIVILNLSTRVIDITGAFVAADIHRPVYVRIDGVIKRH